MTDPVLHARLPFAPWADPRTRRLPGILPMDPDDWLRVDEAYAGQMALRDRLIADSADRVHALLPGAEAAAEELYDRVLATELPRLGFRLSGGSALRPDGVEVALDRARPLLTLGRLVQEDLCLMQAGTAAGEEAAGEAGDEAGGEHVLTGAILCFPAGWTLSEKIGRPMLRIHAPVEKYTGDVGRRVQRLFDAIRPGQPLWRQNAHFSKGPLFNPLSEAQGQYRPPEGELPYIRSERQGLVRLPLTGAVVFSIHTYLVPETALDAGQRAALAEFPIHRAK